MRLLLASTAMLSVATTSLAADRYHVVTPSFGCVVPWTTWVINDQRSLLGHEPQWLLHVIERGRCHLVSPIQEWQAIGSNGRLLLLEPLGSQNGLPPLLFRPADLRRGQMKVELATPAPPDPVVAQALPPAISPPVAMVPPVPTATASMVAPIVPSPVVAPGATPPAPVALPVKPSAPTARMPAVQPSQPLPPASASAGPNALEAPVPTVATATASMVAPIVPPPVVAPRAATPGPVPVPIPVPVQIPVRPYAPTVIVPAAQPSRPPLPAPSVARPHALEAPVRARHPRSRGWLAAGLVALALAALALIARQVGPGLAIRRRERMADRMPGYGLAEPEFPAPPIDRDGYRRRCIDFLAEGGWEARPCFPGGGLTADIMARRGGRLLTVQCRPSTQPLEAAVVREALVVRAAQDAALSAVVSNAGYTKAARSLAAASGVLLLHDTELPELVS